MGFLNKLTTAYGKQVKKSKAAHAKKDRAADTKARKQLALAQTQAERERVRLQLLRDRATLRRELAEGRAEAKKLKKEVERERWNSSFGGKAERFLTPHVKKLASEAGRGFDRMVTDLSKPKRKSPRRKTTKTAVTTRRRTVR